MNHIQCPQQHKYFIKYVINSRFYVNYSVFFSILGALDKTKVVRLVLNSIILLILGQCPNLEEEEES